MTTHNTGKGNDMDEFKKAVEVAAKMKPEHLRVNVAGGHIQIIGIYIGHIDNLNSDQIDTLAGLFGYDVEVCRSDMKNEGWFWDVYKIEKVEREPLTNSYHPTKLEAARSAFTAIMRELYPDEFK